MEKRVRFRSRWLPWALLAPQLAIIGVCFFWPASQALLQSLQQQGVKRGAHRGPIALDAVGMGSGSFTTLTRISIILGFLILFYQLFFSMYVTQIFLGIVRQYVFVIVMFYVLFVPKADVVIYDQIKNPSAGVNNVPYGVALFAHIFTSTEKGLTTLFENSFSLPNDIAF